MISLVLLASFAGLTLNMSFAGLLVQPDWSLATLLAVLLSNRQTWWWVLPSVWFHDIALYWSAWVSFPYVLVVAMMLLYADKRLGSGQQQRWFGVIFGCTSLLIAGISVWDWLLTMMLCVWLWFLLSSQREGNYVESA